MCFKVPAIDFKPWQKCHLNYFISKLSRSRDHQCCKKSISKFFDTLNCCVRQIKTYFINFYGVRAKSLCLIKRIYGTFRTIWHNAFFSVCFESFSRKKTKRRIVKSQLVEAFNWIFSLTLAKNRYTRAAFQPLFEYVPFKMCRKKTSRFMAFNRSLCSLEVRSDKFIVN